MRCVLHISMLLPYSSSEVITIAEDEAIGGGVLLSGMDLAAFLELGGSDFLGRAASISLANSDFCSF